MCAPVSHPCFYSAESRSTQLDSTTNFQGRFWFTQNITSFSTTTMEVVMTMRSGEIIVSQEMSTVGGVFLIVGEGILLGSWWVKKGRGVCV